MNGALPTVTVTFLVAVPNSVVAVSVYVVEVCGFTVTLFSPVTSPTPLSILKFIVPSPEVVQLNVTSPPTSTLVGVAVNVLITGGGSVKFAVSVTLLSSVTKQRSVPLQGSPQPVKIALPSGVASSAIIVPVGCDSEQTSPQSMPVFTLLTLPAPAPVFSTVKTLSV